MSLKRDLLLKHMITNIKLLSRRQFTKAVAGQNLEEKDMSVFQYATEQTQRKPRIYMWGNTMFGALGNANFFRHIHRREPRRSMHKPWRFPFADKHKIKDVACGYGFTVIAGYNDDTDYTLFGTGLNSDFQIGYQCKRPGRPLEIVLEPVPIVLPLLNPKTRVVQVACGRAHTVAVTDKEGIFSLGNNAYGQCGTPYFNPNVDQSSFRINEVKIDDEISRVTCGQDHTLFLGHSGSVYSCGWGADGQTGLGHYKNQMIPEKVKGDIEGETIVQLSCASDCVLALSDKGDVFGWGNSEYGQFNFVTDSQEVNIPRHIKFKNISRVKQVASGGTMCGVLSDNGEVFVWGYGILGQGPDVVSSLKPTILPPPLFGCNQFNSDVKVKQLTCSLSHFAAVTNNGHLYMWGRNRENCLGIGRPGNQFFPYKVGVPGEVLKVSCGVDHTAVICKPFA